MSFVVMGWLGRSLSSASGVSAMPCQRWRASSARPCGECDASLGSVWSPCDACPGRLVPPASNMSGYKNSRLTSVVEERGQGDSEEVMGKLNRLPRRLAAVRGGRDLATFATAPQVTRGRHTYGQPRTPGFAGSAVEVEIGSLRPSVANVDLLLEAEHNTPSVTTFLSQEIFSLPWRYEQHPVYRGPAVIGKDVWIGRDAVILDELTVGHGAVMGVHAVVTKHVRPYPVVGGVLARETRRRFTDEEVGGLLEIASWDLPEDEIIREVAAVNGGDIGDFIARFRPVRDHAGAKPLERTGDSPAFGNPPSQLPDPVARSVVAIRTDDPSADMPSVPPPESSEMVSC